MNLRFFAFALVLGMIVAVILKLPVLFWIFAGFALFTILTMRVKTFKILKSVF